MDLGKPAETVATENAATTPVNTQATAPETVVAPVVTTTEGAVAAPEVSPLISALSDVFNFPEGITESEVKEHLSSWYDRANQLKPDENLEQLRQAANQYQHLAPQLTEFQKWQQQQEAARAQAEQQAAAAKESRWQYPELSPFEQSLITTDESGNFVPRKEHAANPAAFSAVTKAVQRQVARQQMAEQFISDPRKFVSEAAADEIARVRQEYEQKFQELEQRLTPIQQQTMAAQAQAEFNAFVQQHHSLLTVPDPAMPGSYKWSPAADAFSQQYSRMVQAGVADTTAREIALDYARVYAGQAAPQNPAAPTLQQPVAAARPVNPQTAAARAIDIAKANIPNSGGSPVVPTGRARTLAQLVEEKSREFAASSGR